MDMVDFEEKPHNGDITNWYKYYLGSLYDYPTGLGYIIVGHYIHHNRFYGSNGHTSYVVSHNEQTGEIETRNSRYRLVGPPIK